MVKLEAFLQTMAITMNLTKNSTRDEQDSTQASIGGRKTQTLERARVPLSSLTASRLEGQFGYIITISSNSLTVYLQRTQFPVHSLFFRQHL